MIPGLRGIEHIGITVPDAEAATRFFVDVPGCEECFTLGPFAAADDLDDSAARRRSAGADPVGAHGPLP